MQADGLDVVVLFGGAGEVADFYGGAHLGLERDALQFDRQSRDARLHTLETVARHRPFALPRIGHSAPERRIMLIADRRIGEVLQRRVRTVHHDFGDRAHHAAGDVLHGAIVGQADIKHAFGFRIHFARDIEAREIKTLRQALAGRGRRRGGNQLGLAFAEQRLAIEAPDLRIEHHRP